MAQATDARVRLTSEAIQVRGWSGASLGAVERRSLLDGPRATRRRRQLRRSVSGHASRGGRAVDACAPSARGKTSIAVRRAALAGALPPQGALACKMLSWEEPLAAQLRALRGKEATHLAGMLRIRAVNMALQVRRTTTPRSFSCRLCTRRQGLATPHTPWLAVNLAASAPCPAVHHHCGHHLCDFRRVPSAERHPAGRHGLLRCGCSLLAASLRLVLMAAEEPRPPHRPFGSPFARSQPSRCSSCPGGP